MVALREVSMRVTLALLALLLCVLSAEASHFRYSTIYWTPIGPSSVRFKLDFAYRRDYEWGRWFGEQYTNVPNDNTWLGGSNQGDDGAYQKFTENNNQYKDYKLRFPVGAQTNNIQLSARGGDICSHWMDTGKIKETPVCTTGQTAIACTGREVSLKADADGDLVIDTTLSKYTPDNCCRDASVAVTDSDFYCSPYSETHGFFLGDGATSTIDVQIAYVTQEMTDLGNHLYGTATVQHTYATPQKADGTPWVAFFQGGNRLTYLNHNKRGRFRIETSVDIQWDSAKNAPLNRSPKATTMPVVPVPYTSRGAKFAKFQIAVIDPDTRQSGTGLPQNEEVRFELADLQGYGGMLASCMSDGERSCINSQSFPELTYTKEDYTNRRQAIINKHCGGTCGGCPKKCIDIFKYLSGRRDGDDSEYDRCFDCEKYPEWKDETHLAHPPKDLFIDPKRGEVVWETGTAEFEVDSSAYVDKESLGEMFLTGASATYYSANVYCDGVSTKPWTAAESLEGKNMNGCITKDVSKESKLSGFYNLALKIYSPKKPGLALGTYANEIFVPLDFLMYLYAPMHYCGLTCQNNQRGPSTFTSIDGYYGYDSVTPAETLSVTGISKPSGLGTGKCTICGGGERADNGTDNRKDASYCKPQNDANSACPSVSTPAFSASNPRDVGYISKGLCPGVKISGGGLEISTWVNNKELPRSQQFWYGRDEGYGQYFGGCDQPRVAQTNEVGSVRPTAGACYLNNAPYFIVGNNPNDQSDNLTPRPHPFESWDYAPTARVARKKGSTITFNLVATDDDSCVELGIRSSGMLSLEGMEDLSNPVYTSYKVNRQGAEVTRSFRWPARITSTANANATTICTAGSATQRVVEGTTLYLCDSLLVPEEDIRPEDTLICFYPFDSYIVGAFLCVHIKIESNLKETTTTTTFRTTTTTSSSTTTTTTKTPTTLPPSPPSPSPLTYSYTTGSWSSCSSSCGGGMQTRSLTCYRSDGQSVSDSYCSGSKPSTSQACNTQACATTSTTTGTTTTTHPTRDDDKPSILTPVDASVVLTGMTKDQFDAEKFANATARTMEINTEDITDVKAEEVAASSKRRRSLTATDLKVTFKVAVKDAMEAKEVSNRLTEAARDGSYESNLKEAGITGFTGIQAPTVATEQAPVEATPTPASTTTKAPTTKTTTTLPPSPPPPPPLTYAYTTGSWSSCSASCGGGTQTRLVTCQRSSDNQVVSDSLCSDSKPSTSQVCSTESCPLTPPSSPPSPLPSPSSGTDPAAAVGGAVVGVLAAIGAGYFIMRRCRAQSALTNVSNHVDMESGGKEPESPVEQFNNANSQFQKHYDNFGKISDVTRFGRSVGGAIGLPGEGGGGGDDPSGMVEAGRMVAAAGRSFPFLGPLFEIANAIYTQAERARICKENCRILSDLVRAVISAIKDAEASNPEVIRRHEGRINDLRGVLTRVYDYIESFNKGWFMKFVSAMTYVNDFKLHDSELRNHISAVGLAIHLAPTAHKYTDETAALRAYIEQNGGTNSALANETSRGEITKMLGVESQVLSAEIARLAELVQSGTRQNERNARHISDKLDQLDAKFDAKMEEMVDALFKAQAQQGNQRASSANKKGSSSLEAMKEALPAFVIRSNDIKKMAIVGEGGFGVVHKATMKGGTQVAVKELHAHRLNRPSIKDFIKEANILSQLKHPNVIAFYGVILEPPMYAMVIHYLENGSMHDSLVDEDQKLAWSLRMRWALGLVAGVNYLHNCDPVVIHGDIKSMNVLLDANKNAVLCDFGMANVKTETSASTATGGGKGITVKWTPPEIFGGRKMSKMSDMYSVAVTLWEIAFRELPLRHMPDPAYVVFIRGGERPPLPTREDTGCPTHYGKVVDACWHQVPESRMSAEKALEELEEMLDQVHHHG